MRYFEGECFVTKYFLPWTVDEAYANYLYAILWFYNGTYPFDNLEEKLDLYWLEEMYKVGFDGGENEFSGGWALACTLTVDSIDSDEHISEFDLKWVMLGRIG